MEHDSLILTIAVEPRCAWFRGLVGAREVECNVRDMGGMVRGCV